MLQNIYSSLYNTISHNRNLQRQRYMLMTQQRGNFLIRDESASEKGINKPSWFTGKCVERG